MASLCCHNHPAHPGVCTLPLSLLSSLFSHVYPPLSTPPHPAPPLSAPQRMGRETFVIRDAHGRRLNDQLQAKRYGDHHGDHPAPGGPGGNEDGSHAGGRGAGGDDGAGGAGGAANHPGWTPGSAEPDGEWALGTFCVIPEEAGDGEGLPASVGRADPGARYEVYDRVDMWDEIVLDGGACGGLKPTDAEQLLVEEGLFDSADAGDA